MSSVPTISVNTSLLQVVSPPTAAFASTIDRPVDDGALVAAAAEPPTPIKVAPKSLQPCPLEVLAASRTEAGWLCRYPNDETSSRVYLKDLALLGQGGYGAVVRASGTLVDRDLAEAAREVKSKYHLGIDDTDRVPLAVKLFLHADLSKAALMAVHESRVVETLLRRHPSMARFLCNRFEDGRLRSRTPYIAFDLGPGRVPEKSFRCPLGMTGVRALWVASTDRSGKPFSMGPPSPLSFCKGASFPI